jgi:hypothetical protein
MLNFMSPNYGSGNVMGSFATNPVDYYGERGIVGPIPGDYTQHGAGFAALSPEAQTTQGLLDYYTRTQKRAGVASHTNPMVLESDGTDAPGFSRLSNYLHGTFFKQGKPIPGTNIYNDGQLWREIFGSSNQGDDVYSKLTPEALTRALGPQAEQMMRQARDWEVREISRKNQTGAMSGTFGKLAKLGMGAALGFVGAPAWASGAIMGGMDGNPLGVLTGAAGGFLGGQVASSGILDKVKNTLGLSAPTGGTAWGGLAKQGFPGGAGSVWSPGGGGWGPVGTNLAAQFGGNFLSRGNQVPGVSTGVTTPTGGGLVGSGQLNPNNVQIMGGAALGASPLAAAGTAGVNLLPGVDDLRQYFNQQIPGTNQQLGGPDTGTLDEEDWLSKLGDTFGADDLLGMFGGQQEGPQGPETGFGMGGVGAGSQGFAQLGDVTGQGPQRDPGVDVFDGITGSVDDEGLLGQGNPQYLSQKLPEEPDIRLPGYQTQPFASAVERKRNTLAL